jgi:hypothetical protein
MKAIPAFHLVELLDASLRGLTADEILRTRGNQPTGTKGKQ